MNRGFYNAASAMITIQKNMQSISNNVANSNTVGYKREQSLEGTFEQMMVNYKGNQLGIIPTKVGQRDNVTIHTQGSFITSGRDLDFALNGDGFFKLQDADGNIHYTRNGTFFIDNSGSIVDQRGFYLMGEEGRIKVPNNEVSANTSIVVNKDGEFFVNNNKLDTIDIVNLENPLKTGHGYYKADGELPSDSKVHQGFLEASNVNMADELTSMIINQRSYQLNGKMVSTQDELNKKVITDLFK